MLRTAAFGAILLAVCSSFFGAQTQSEPALQPQASENKSASLMPGDVEILSDTMGVDFAPYLNGVVDTVKHHWLAVTPDEARQPTMKSSTVAIQFAILKDGRVTGMVLKKSSGDAALDRAAWSGVTNSGTLSPLPEAFHGPYLALNIKFQYNPEIANQKTQAKEELPAAPEVKTTAPSFRIASNQNQEMLTTDSDTSPSPALSPSMLPSIDIIEPKTVLTYDLKQFLEQRLTLVIRRHWINLVPDKVRGKKGKRGSTVVVFSVERDGTFQAIEMEESSGDDEMDGAALAAVRESAPIPLPSSVPGDHLKLRIHFYYNPPKSKREATY